MNNLLNNINYDDVVTLSLYEIFLSELSFFNFK